MVKQGDLQQLKPAIEKMAGHKDEYNAECRKRAVECFNKNERFEDYVGLFDRVCGNY